MHGLAAKGSSGARNGTGWNEGRATRRERERPHESKNLPLKIVQGAGLRQAPSKPFRARNGVAPRERFEGGTVTGAQQMALSDE